MTEEGADIACNGQAHALGIDVLDETLGPSRVAALRAGSVVAQLHQALHFRDHLRVAHQLTVTFSGLRCGLTHTELATIQAHRLSRLLNVPVRSPWLSSQLFEEDPK